MSTEDAPEDLPDAALPERVFGTDGVWRPAGADLPAALTHAPTRRFLTEAGLPCVKLGRIGLDSLFLRADGLWPRDADELYAESRPGGDAAVSDVCFRVMEHPDFVFVLDAGSGGVDLFRPDGWDRGLGYGGRYAPSLPVLVQVLGLAVEALGQVDELGVDEVLERLDPRLDALGVLERHPDLWTGVFEYIDEYHDDVPLF